MDQKKQLFNPGPLHSERHGLVSKLKELPVKTGDIFFRLDNFKFLGIPFSRLVAKLSKSKYSHAAIAYIENDDIYLVEVSDMGTTKYLLVDWIDFCFSKDFCIYRAKNITEVESEELISAVEEFLVEDYDYDYSFSNSSDKFYCTQSVASIYKKAGLPLAPPVKLNEIVGWFQYWLIISVSFFLKPITGKGISSKTPLYLVGNEKIGLMSSQIIEKIYQN